MSVPSILVIDNVDSFTFMLVDYLKALGAEGQDGILISPGPGRPEDAGISVELAGVCIERRHPLLGVCLGHQAIALACGSRVERTPPIHGKVGAVRHDGTGLFANLPTPLAATRYHSLAVSAVEPPLIANAWSADGTIMAMRHEGAPVYGVQFHPESVASEYGRELLGAFLKLF